jgi:sugar lactone lactonase YvrE
MNVRYTALILFAFLVTFSTIILAQEDIPSYPDEILFEAPMGLQPEGIVWDEAGERFLVGSILDGTIGSVDDEGVYTPMFIDESFVSTVGLHIADGKLYIANGSLSVFRGGAGNAGLAVYDLEAEELLFSVDLNETHDGTGGRFANDVTVDPDGNAYVTDSRQPVIYKVTPEGEASVFVTSPLLGGRSIGGNGIDYHPDGFLLVAVVESLSLVRIPLDDPEALAVVEWDTLSAIDGLVLSEDGTTLYGVANINGGSPAIVAYASEDGWETATLTARGDSNRASTTLTLRGDKIYFIIAQIQNTRATEYQILRAVFEE